MYSNNQGNLPRNSSDKDVHHEHTRKRGTQKYLMESCYHRIECTASTFLAAFMWKRPLNSVALATTTHRKPKRVSDETGIQVRAQMINKCRIKMVQRELYNGKDPPYFSLIYCKDQVVNVISFFLSFFFLFFFVMHKFDIYPKNN